MIKEKYAIIQSRAVFSKDGKYRYLLEKKWDDKKRNITIIMINPSYADELKTDPTVCKLMNFAADNDFGSIKIVNLYAFISTENLNPGNIENAVGELNDKYILDAINNTDLIIVAWGVDKKKYRERKSKISKMLKKADIKIKGFIDDKNRIGAFPGKLSNLVLADYIFE